MKQIPAIRAGILVLLALGAAVVLLAPRLQQLWRAPERGSGWSQARVAEAPPWRTEQTATAGVQPPPRFQPGRLPVNYRRMPEARWNATDERLADWLQVKARKGPVPRDLGDLKQTPGFSSKALAAIDDDADVDFRLRLLTDLDICFKAANIPAGGAAVVTFFFDYDDRGNVVAKEPTLEASTVDPEFQAAYNVCLSQAFTGKSFRRPKEPGEYMHAWPTTIPVPAKHHELLHVLLPES